MDGTVLGPHARPRPQRWEDQTANENRQHSLDWAGPLNGRTISAVSWVSNPTGLVFSSSTIASSKTSITITPPAVTGATEYLIHAKITDSAGEIHETNPPIKLTVQPGGDF